MRLWKLSFSDCQKSNNPIPNLMLPPTYHPRQIVVKLECYGKKCSQRRYLSRYALYPKPRYWCFQHSYLGRSPFSRWGKIFRDGEYPPNQDGHSKAWFTFLCALYYTLPCLNLSNRIYQNTKNLDPFARYSSLLPQTPFRIWKKSSRVLVEEGFPWLV